MTEKNPAEALPDSPEVISLTTLVQELLALRERKAKIEKQIKEMAVRERYLEEEIIPSTMITLNVSDITTTDGHKVTLADSVHVSVGGENKPRVIGWLEEIEAADLVKTQLTLKFSHKERDVSERCILLLEDAGFAVAKALDVHSGTFTAFLKERLQNGDDIPWERIHARSFQKAKIK